MLNQRVVGGRVSKREGHVQVKKAVATSKAAVGEDLNGCERATRQVSADDSCTKSIRLADVVWWSQRKKYGFGI